MKVIQDIDLSILDSIHENLTNSFLDVIMPYITAIADKGILYIILAIVLIFIKRTRRYGIMLGTALLLGLIFGNLILKNVIARPRPFSLTGTELLIPAPEDFSFPSGHTMASFETATVLFYANRRAGTAMIILASIVAYSRLYLYVHYPTDVLCGCVLGILFGSTAILMYNLIEKKTIQKI